MVGITLRCRPADRVLQGGPLIKDDGVEEEVMSREDPLEFGIGSIFVRDPDGNLIEFLQLGHGIFADRTGDDT